MYKRYRKISYFTQFVFLSLAIIFQMVGMDMAPKETEVKKRQVDIQTIQLMCALLHKKICIDNFTPELLVGLSRGGLIPLGFLAGEQMFNNRNTKIINIHSYNYDKRQAGINLIMLPHLEDITNFKSMLVIDDLVDTGRSIEYLIDLLKKNTKNPTIKIATLFYKPHSRIQPDYYIEETKDWIVFPWEK